jgi:chromosome segregation ATPase
VEETPEADIKELNMLGFLKQYLVKKTDDVQSGFLKLIVEFDPESASEAEIGELDEILTTLTRQMVTAKASWDKEQQEAEAIKKAYALRVGAAERLQAQAEAAPAEQKAAIEASLAKLVEELEKMVPEVEREEAEAKEAKTYYDELNQAVKTASERLKTARARLTDAKRRMDMAKVRVERAAEQEDRAKVLSGIKQQADKLGTAFDAMTKRAEELETTARVHQEKAKLLAMPKAEEDPLIAQAMKDAAGTPPEKSLGDRLAALKNK